MDTLINLDYQIFQSLNSLAGKNAVFDNIVIFFAHWAVYFLAVGLVIWWFFLSDKIKTRQALVTAFISFIIGRFGIVELIRLGSPRTRPFLGHQVTQLIVKDAEKSFPSGHATALFAIAMAIYFYNKKFGIWLFAIAVLVSLARVVAGVHYPLDIVGGAGAGILTAWVIEKFFGIRLAGFSAKLSEKSDRIFTFTKR